MPSVSPFLLVRGQLLLVPDLKLMEILFHHFDPLSPRSSYWSSSGDISYRHLFCYSLFWKYLYMFQPAQSLCPYYRRYLGFAVHLHQFVFGPCSHRSPSSFHRVSTRVLPFLKSPAFLSLFGSFSKVHCHKRPLDLSSFYRNLFLSSLICSWLLVSAPKPPYILCPLLFFLESLCLPCRCQSVLHPSN